MPAGVSDIELVRLALRGDDKAFGQLLESNRPRVIAICLRMLGDRVEAEEAAQDSFVKIYFHLRDFDQARDFTAWAASITMNECRDRLRRRTRHGRVFREISEVDAVAEPAAANANDGVSARFHSVVPSGVSVPFAPAVATIAACTVCVTGDHATPCVMRDHSLDPVPIMVKIGKKDNVMAFNEVDCSKGSLGHLTGPEIMPLLSREARDV